MKKIAYFLLLLLSILIFSSLQQTKAESFLTIPNCTSSECLTSKINDVVLANNKSFVLVSYDSNFIRKIDINSDFTTEDSIIPFNDSSNSSSPFNISISNDDNQVLIYNNDSIYLLNLTDNSVRKLTIEGEVIKNISFLDKEGNQLIATNENTASPKLLIINTQTTDIETTVPLPDVGDVIKISPSGDKVIILFKNILTQTLSIYDANSSKLYRFDLPDFLFFSVDEFLDKVEFDQNSNKAVLSSLDGIHVLHLINLREEKIKFSIKILSNNIRGKTLSTLNKEGTLVISAGQNKNKNKIILYKSIISNHKKPQTVKKVHLKNITALNDIYLSNENNFVFILAKKGINPMILVLNLKDLSVQCEIDLNESFSNSQFAYAVDSNFLLLPIIKGTEIGLISPLNACQE